MLTVNAPLNTKAFIMPVEDYQARAFYEIFLFLPFSSKTGRPN